jgi:hypothetical protein
MNKLLTLAAAATALVIFSGCSEQTSPETPTTNAVVTPTAPEKGNASINAPAVDDIRVAPAIPRTV